MTGGLSRGRPTLSTGAIPVLETARLRLRAHVLSDFEASAAMWADPGVIRHITGEPSTREASWSRFLRYPGHWRLLGFGYWALQCKASGDFLGEVGFADYHRDMTPTLGGRPEAGWVLKTAAHGQGFATEAVRRMCDWADGLMDHPETVAIFDPAHHASIRVAEKTGYAPAFTATYRGQPTQVMARSRAAPSLRSK